MAQLASSCSVGAFLAAWTMMYKPTSAPRIDSIHKARVSVAIGGYVIIGGYFVSTALIQTDPLLAGPDLVLIELLGCLHDTFELAVDYIQWTFPVSFPKSLCFNDYQKLRRFPSANCSLASPLETDTQCPLRPKIEIGTLSFSRLKSSNFAPRQITANPKATETINRTGPSRPL
jgi:hypothetical protein